MAMKISSINAQHALEQLGENLKIARLKRRISLQDFADRTGVSKRTVSRLEKGENGVSIGALAAACLVLGELDRIGMFLDPGSDDTGLLLDRDNLPKRIDSSSAGFGDGSGSGGGAAAGAGYGDGSGGGAGAGYGDESGTNDEGVGF